MAPREAFETAAGFELQDIGLILAGLGCVVIILWAAWSSISAFRGWVKGNVDSDVLGFAVVRIVILILLFIWLFV